jgi:hypothetical protein
MLKGVSELFSQKVKAAILITIGSLTWAVTMIKSGWIYSYGMGFWGPNGHDGIWHIALINSISRGTLEMPVFAGQALKNYHLGFDLLTSFLHRIFTVPAVNLYFQILPLIFSLLIGLLTYWFVDLLTNSKKTAFWATFFVYFGGSFGWRGESMFWSQQAISTLINPSFTLSLIFILLGLICLLKFQNTHKALFIVLGSILFGLLIEIKVYAGILVLGGLLVAGLWRLGREKKLDILLSFCGSLVLSLILFLPSFKSSSKLLVYQPFWFLETMMQLTDRVGWIRFGEAMVNYKAGRIWFKAIIAYSVAFVIFIVGNFGTRIIAFWQIKNLKKFSWIEVLFFSIIGAGIVIPMLFLQTGTAWNTIQFFYYSLFFSGILAGIVIGNFLEKHSDTLLYNSVSIAIILLTIPTTIGTLYYVYLPSRPPAIISNEELKALKFLSEKPNGVVLTYPYDPIKAKEAEKNPPRPLYLYESTAYVSAFSNKPVFLEDQVNLDITGYDWKNRRAEVEEFYQALDQKMARGFLKSNNIKYIYWVKPQRARLGESQLGLKRIFENKEVDIWEVK